MSANSKIEWCDHTFNPWIGCTRVSPGCDHCYAAVSTPARAMSIAWGVDEPRHRTAPNNWKQPIAWNARHDAFFAEHGRRQRVFCASLADVFDNAVDPIWRADLFALIADTPNLDWLLLTKRIGNAGPYLDAAMAALPCRMPSWAHAPWPNVWLGATIVNQEEADRDIPKLLEVPARVRFLSMEPLLGPVDLARVRSDRHGRVHALEGWYCDDRISIVEHTSIDWVIAGGESGTHARPMHPDWNRSLRDQCAAAGVPFLFKQWGEWAPGSGDFGAGRFETAAVALDGRVVAGGYEASEYPPGAASNDHWAMVHRAGKKAAGRHLDGMTHDGFPASPTRQGERS